MKGELATDGELAFFILIRRSGLQSAASASRTTWARLPDPPPLATFQPWISIS
jgi:hypothetical protein